jgi:hypothetical protein
MIKGLGALMKNAEKLGKDTKKRGGINLRNLGSDCILIFREKTVDVARQHGKASTSVDD